MEAGLRKQEAGQSMGTKAIQRFEDLEVWKRGMSLSVAVYSSLQSCKDFGLRDQMQRAAVSVPSNIAEGFERGSNKEFLQSLKVARGSLGELRTQLYLALKLGVIAPEIARPLITETRELSAMSSRLAEVRRTRF